MASTNFVDGVTPIQASWLNDINSVIYTLLSNNGQVPTSLNQLKQNLGLSGMALQSSSAVNITGGKINGTIIGDQTPSTATFTTAIVQQVLEAKSTIVQEYAGMTRRLTPLGGGLVREFSDMVTKVLATSVAQSSAGTTLTFTATAGVYPGYLVTGTGIADGTTVSSVSGTNVSLSLSTTTAVPSGTSITFSPAIGAVELGNFFNYDMATNTRDITGVVFGSYFNEAQALYNYVYSSSASAGSAVAATDWKYPFSLNLVTGDLSITGVLTQQFAGLTRSLTPGAGAKVREYCDIAPAGGLPTTGNIEFGMSFNAGIDVAAGTWLGRDKTAGAWLKKFSDSAPYSEEVFFAADAAAGVVPVWVKTYNLNLETGAVTFGNITNAGTATPVALSMGGTYSNGTAGSYDSVKVRVWDSGTNAAGLAAYSVSMGYVLSGSGWTAGHRFYNNGVLQAVIGSSTEFLALPAGTATKAPILFSTGVELTTAVAGAMEYDGINYYLTPASAVRRKIFTELEKYTAITTAGNGTLTAAAMYGGVILRTGPTAAYTDTTDTAANLIALVGAGVGNHFYLYVINGVAFACTLAGGTGVTLAGNTPTAIGASAVKEYIGVVTSATTVTLYGV